MNSPQTIPALPVDAPFDKTWDATVSWFAEKNLPVRTIDIASGVIVVDVPADRIANKLMTRKARDYSAFLEFADCGARDDIAYSPSSAVYNVRVSKDGEKSQLLANARFEQDGSGVGNKFFVCHSTGKWENDLRAFVKQRAETSR